MKQEDKDLLLKDLCARLPYGVKCYKSKYNTELVEEVICVTRAINYPCVQLGTYLYELKHIKPYLFPLSSMTEEQKTFFDDKHIDIDDILGIVAIFAHVNCEEWIEIIDWLNKNRFDYRGLIEKSLALDATGLDIY